MLELLCADRLSMESGHSFKGFDPVLKVDQCGQPVPRLFGSGGIEANELWRRSGVVPPQAVAFTGSGCG